jgi:dTDP-4-amino-4,6-dideoxygalactose transaminase
VIIPSFTFVSTVNAFALRGARPVFADVRADTLNLDVTRLEPLITGRTRAVVPVHYAGIGCEMDAILEIAGRRNLAVVEDNAHGLLGRYQGRLLGVFGSLATQSFHETKNFTCGEGGALVINDEQLVEPAEILREKGTNRSRFFRGQVDKYTWVDVGSSFLPSELVAAFLLAQLEDARDITDRRLAVWNAYHAAFAAMEQAGGLRRPVIPAHCAHNAHMYYLLLPTMARRDRLLKALNDQGIKAVFHYVPLHDAPAGRRHGRPHGDLARTMDLSGRLLRLPLWVGLPDAAIEAIRRIVAET